MIRSAWFLPLAFALRLEATFTLTEKARARLETAILAAKQPAEHVITVAAVT